MLNKGSPPDPCKFTLVFRVLFSISLTASIHVSHSYIHDKFLSTETLTHLGIMIFATCL